MIVFFRFCLLLFLVFLIRETESQVVNITSRPSSPLRVLEGQSVTLEWRFSVVTILLRVELKGSKSPAAVADATPDAGKVRGIFRGRGTASTTETNATITLFSLTRTDTDNYTFVVLDDDGPFAQAPLQIIVQYPPSLIKRAPDQVVVEGDPAAAIILICTAQGEPVPNITWTEVFANGSDSDVLFTGEQFELPRNRTSDGTYRCNASNGIRSDVNHTVNVTVNFKPERFVFMVKSSNENFCKGGIINITCSAVGKPMVHTYQLFKDGTLVHTSNNSVLFWSEEATAGGEIMYSCVANNTVATASTTKNITVNEGSVIEQLENVTAVEGMDKALNCIVTGIPMPSVSWLEVQTGNHSSQNPFVFASVSRKQAGKYICHASNPCGNDSKSGILTVIYPPEGVQLQASEDTVCKGANVIFNCSAADANPMELTYHLYENNVIVSNSSTGIWNRTMTIEGVFGYKCNVTNSVGTAMSSNVSVTVSVPPSIQPIDNEMIIEGGNLTLTCNASGFPAPTVYWVKTGTEERFNERKLVFPNINRSEAGEYTCFASTPCNTSTELAVVDVQFKPEMVQLVPSETTVCQGEIMAFNCSANSNPAVHTYQLYVNGSMVIEVSSTGVWNITMTTGGVFVYKCKVNNTIGTAMSENITITVNVPPSIQPINNEMVIEDGNVTLTCNASGFPTPTVYWVKTSNGVRFNKTELVFTNINRSEAGEYTCSASNPCNTATELADIDVQYAPEITNISEPQTLNRGEVLNLNCVADGNPLPNITWTKISNGNDVNMPLIVTGKEYEGGYRCTASNRIGNDTNDTSVTVNLPALAVASADKNTVQKGGNVTLFCSVSGTPTPSVIWTHVDTGNKHYNETWIISDITFNDLGEYRCDAINIYGNDTNSTFILFKGGKCEDVCKDGKTCRSGLGTIPLCHCEEGKTGKKCEENESAKNKVEGRFKFRMEFKGVYNDLENNETKRFIERIEGAVEIELNGTGLIKARVTALQEGCVIADMELTFNRDIYEDSVRVLLQDATKDNKLGDLEVQQVVVGELIPGEKCEEDCKNGTTCRSGPGTIPLCLCEDGKTGEKCEKSDSAKKFFEAGVEFAVDFKKVYNDLENSETKTFTERIKLAVEIELNGTGLTKVRVTALKEGSVIADLELTFNKDVYEDFLRKRLLYAIKDNKLGDLAVKQVVVGKFINGRVEPKPIECNIFFKGEKCKEASGPLIALIVVAVILVVAILIGIVACSLHKKNASGGGSFQNVKVSQRQDPEGNNSLARDYVEPGGSRETLHGNDNTGYDPERPPESTQMVTFNSNNGQMQGIHLPDSRSQKAQPGEGTYADLGDFQPKPTAPATLPPIKKPPTYEETNYAEITQFLKAPVAPKQDEGPQEELALLEAPVEEPDENAKDDAWNNLNNDSAALSRETKEETNADKLYPSLELVKSENKTEQIVVSI